MSWAASAFRCGTTFSAPAASASFAFSPVLTVAITRAPAQRASWMVACPTAPAPPATSTVRPARLLGVKRAGESSCTVKARRAVTAGMPMLAPSSNDASSGSGTAYFAGTTTCSCAVPPGRPYPTSHSQTSCPASSSVTPSPRASTVPAPSLCGTTSGNSGAPPCRNLKSIGLTPDTATRAWKR
jgi:hypothetical protein